MTPSENELVALARAGDTQAFDELVALHQERVFALAYRITGNRDDAADAQQETFVRAWRSLGRYRGDAALSTWLHRITVNVCLSRRGRSRPFETYEELRLEQSAASGDVDPVADCVTRADTASVIRKVLGGMPAHYRVLLALREIEGRPFDEIARILGCSVESARVRASKARRMLRERLEPLVREDEL